ncbi:preprotein translocase subunit SecE [Actinobaculum suis]|uniref:Protein translocase subunit SecE n=1 Tax=Actinobaculum suis TaxID=1657 RepID=A0A0K9EVX5_9ACTO|nr:preprotein translocase subunit SecE [Actinobaculum suis]KMY24166.1 preprotein translocase subunit SecE [Actinobaculum suis]MDY5153489.1 preprotein translocase subunit SecE [Actinobaculum suis]OCA93453.1 preprotein translocase subunit SecE [Actinobaculum suis]OCA95261.1 preprotein translocase subunit SecE [Actinobaculum suis]SDE19609.1 preprotein translocase subunit SecE [Actinobaculum suis]
MSQTAAASKRESADKKGVFARLAQFFREIFSELKKVQRPTRDELWQMFITVLVFVLAVMVFVGIFDLLFGQLTFWIFG